MPGENRRKRVLLKIVESHRADSAWHARQAQRYYHDAVTKAGSGRCQDALTAYTIGSEQHGAYKTEKRHARAATVGKVGVERGARAAQAKARKALTSCFVTNLARRA